MTTPPATPFAIAPATAADAAALTAVAEAAYAPYVPRMGRRPAPMLDDFPALIDRGHVLVVRRDAAILGYIVLYPEGEDLHVSNVAVDPAAQGQGIGCRLLAVAEAEAGRRGLAAVALYTNVHMTENLALYPRLGYAETGRRRQDGFDRVFFRKTI